MRLVLGPLLALSAAACVPDFAYRDDGTTQAAGPGSGGRDAGSGGRTGQGGDGGRSASGVGVATGPGTGTGPGPGPGPGSGPTTGTSTTDAATTSGSGGDGGGTIGPSASSSATSTGATTGSGTPGVPCWDGFNDQTTTCLDGDVCCFDPDFYSEHECTSPGGCDVTWETELGCNEPSDCGTGQQCCADVDGLGYLLRIRCDSPCDDFVACSAQEHCPGGTTCYYVFDPDDYPEYAQYGFCGES